MVFLSFWIMWYFRNVRVFFWFLGGGGVLLKLRILNAPIMM